MKRGLLKPHRDTGSDSPHKPASERGGRCREVDRAGKLQGGMEEEGEGRLKTEGRVDCQFSVLKPKLSKVVEIYDRRN